MVEDDPRLGPLLLRGLAEEGFRADLARDADEADLFMGERTYDCVILDRRLPGTDGDTLLQRWRRRGVEAPVLILTALDQVEERVLGLDLGADDYLVKPFAFQELAARVRALIRRAGRGGGGAGLAGPAEGGPGGLAVDLKGRRVYFRGQELPLTGSEFRVAALLVRNAGRTVPRSRLAEVLWEEPWEGSDNALEAHVKNLRKKLAAARVPAVIRAVRGLGYRLELRE